MGRTYSKIYNRILKYTFYKYINITLDIVWSTLLNERKKYIENIIEDTSNLVKFNKQRNTTVVIK